MMSTQNFINFRPSFSSYYIRTMSIMANSKYLMPYSRRSWSNLKARQCDILLLPFFFFSILSRDLKRSIAAGFCSERTEFRIRPRDQLAYTDGSAFELLKPQLVSIIFNNSVSKLHKKYHDAPLQKIN
jgi:hypothetical protein